MAGKNDITGDSLTSKASNKAYDEGWDRIFNKEKKDLNYESDNPLERPYEPSAVDDAADVMSKYSHPVYTRYPHLKDKDFKKTQQELTELNADGNEERGRYGEDLRK